MLVSIIFQWLNSFLSALRLKNSWQSIVIVVVSWLDNDYILFYGAD